ncbi:MAG: hypothetical protein U0800_18845 [Isosphaeraceae bacterium]
MRRTPLALLLVAFACTACSPGDSERRAAEQAAAREFDGNAARDALVAALDAWKQGKAKQLDRRLPPIRFADDDMASGWALVGYELRDTPIVPMKDVPVTLLLRDRRGQSLRREAHYQVATFPALVVHRTDF